MRCTVPPQPLAFGLAAVSRMVSPRATLPILGNVLVECQGSELRVAATNLDLSLRHELSAEVEDPGRVTVPARILSEFVAALPDAPLSWSLDTDTQTVHLSCAGFDAHIRGVDAAEFPPLPTLDDGTQLDLEATVLARAIEQTVLAASSDEARPLYTGVLTEIAGRAVTLVATDGHRLAVRRLTAGGREAAAEGSEVPTQTIILPARALAELGRLLRGQAAGTMVRLAVSASQTQASFDLPGFQLHTRLIEGTYPSYTKVVPTSGQSTVRLANRELLATARVVALFARDAANVVKLRCEPGSVTISAATNEVGDNQASVPATMTGEPLGIAFNARYLLDVLQILESEEVELLLNGSLAPGLVRAVGDDSYRYVIMPVRVAL
ncbi:MAG TPA: DNA polymerase III subunit beta [Candidatus Micrarchaeia archaeon]|nr:DNA polymerase III subunit beta [Candidatus Micrarchaeia archaeon]